MKKIFSFLSGIPAWVLLAAFVPRVVVLAIAMTNQDYLVTLDSAGYLSLAGTMFSDLSFGYTGPYGGYVPETFRTPGYPLFLSFAALLPGGAVLAGAVLQTLIGGATAVLAWKWFLSMFGRRGAAAGLVFFALDYVTVMHTPMILAETLLMAVLLAASVLTCRALEEPSPRGAFPAGSLWGAAAFIKPVALYFPVAAVFMFRGARKAAVIFLASALVLPAAWSFRNYLVAGKAGFSSIGGVVLLKYAAGSVESLRTGKSFSETWPSLVAEAEASAPEGGFGNDSVRAAAYTAKALPILMEHPVLVVRYLLKGLAATAAGTGLEMLPQLLGMRHEFPSDGGLGGGTAALLRAYPWLWGPQIVYTLFLGTVYVLFGLGLRSLWTSGRRRLAVFLLVATVYFFGMASTNGYYRYRIVPMLFMSAGAAAVFSARRRSGTVPENSW